MRRIGHFLLAVFLVVAAVTATAHATVHADSLADQCQLCASHANGSPAGVAPSYQAPTVAGHGPPPRPALPAPLPQPARLAPPPRAPPATS